MASDSLQPTTDNCDTTYFLCKRCGLVFTLKEIQEADNKCPACFAPLVTTGQPVLLPCTKDGALL